MLRVLHHERKKINDISSFPFVLSAVEGLLTVFLGTTPRLRHSSMERWNHQADMDVSGRILHTWMPAIHAGMTKLSIFILCGRA